MEFKFLNLKKELLKSLESMNFHTMTPVQEMSLDHSLSGKDIIVKAKTGSGKTVAFGLPVLQKLNVKRFRIQSMILTPTRELANQVANELKKLASTTHNIKIITLCGGMPYRPQVHSLSHQAHIIVGTPGRILKHLEEDSFDPSEIEILVLDEADRMLDMGFNEDINKIIKQLPSKRQTMLFSATYPEHINSLSKSIMKSPLTVEVASDDESSSIKQSFFQVQKDKKLNATLKILSAYRPQSTIIFCNTKIDCDNLADELEDTGLDVLVIHSDLEQKDRVETLVLFESRSYPILIATDVASRGLDIDDIELVLNYELPYDTEVYTHRIGRTARAGKSGNAVSFVDYDHEDTYEEIRGTNHYDSLKDMSIDTSLKLESPWRCIFINGGKKHKVRAGDILGTLCVGLGMDKVDVGKISIGDYCSYVAIKQDKAKNIHKQLSNTKIKGKLYRVYLK